MLNIVKFLIIISRVTKYSLLVFFTLLLCFNFSGPRGSLSFHTYIQHTKKQLKTAKQASTEIKAKNMISEVEKYYYKYQ